MTASLWILMVAACLLIVTLGIWVVATMFPARATVDPDVRPVPDHLPDPIR